MPLFNESKLKRLRKIDKMLRSIYLFPKNNRKQLPLNKNEVREIVIIAFLLIGDSIMYIPAVKVIRKNFPFAKITLVCGSLVQTIFNDQELADDYVIVNCPWISPFDKSVKNIFKFLWSIIKVNRKKYDLSVDFRGDWRNIFYMNFIKAKRKAGFNFSGGEYMLTDVISLNNKPDHLIDETFALLEEINCEFEQIEKYPTLKITSADQNYLDNFKTSNNLNDRFIIGIHPGASLSERKWDEEKYGELLVRMANTDPNDFFLLFEGPGESETIAKIKKILDDNHVDYLILLKSLHEYLILMSLCDLIICNDSGAAHVAAAYKIPEVVIFGKGDPKEVKPFNLNKSIMVSHNLECKPCHLINCKFGTNLCMKMVTVDEVYEQATGIIKYLVN